MIAEAFLIAALALPVISGPHPRFSAADVAFLRILTDLTEEKPGSVIFYGRHGDLAADMKNVCAGGFLLIKRRYAIFFEFNQRDWSEMPPSWKNYRIFRKRLLESA